MALSKPVTILALRKGPPDLLRYSEGSNAGSVACGPGSRAKRLKTGITKNSEGSYRNLDARAATGVGANRAGGQPAFVLKARSGATLPGILGAQLAANRLLIEAGQRLPAQSRNIHFAALSRLLNDPAITQRRHTPRCNGETCFI